MNKICEKCGLNIIKKNMLETLRIKQGFDKKKLSENSGISMDRINELCTFGTKITLEESLLLGKMVNCDDLFLIIASEYESELNNIQ